MVVEKMSGAGGNHKLNGNLISLAAKSQVPPQQQQQQQQAHQQPQQQQQQISASSSASIQHPAQIHSTTVATVHHQISSGHHPTSNGQSSASTASGIPPRYQPPPQPPGGILKHIPTQKSNFYPPELSVPHLNIKYPPEIPKLASVYIPDSVKSSGNPSRFSQRAPLHRLSSGHIPVLTQNQSIHHEDHILRQQQQQQQQQQHQQQEMLKFVRKPDADPTGPSQGPTQGPPSGAGRLTAEQNRHLQSLLAELRALKEANQRLSDDNQELRDLCCFLDDDRQKGRKLAREWQRFGRYTASVMRQEVSAYQNKLRQLDDKQQELIRDNLELKELCLYLDEERAHVAANTLCANCGAATRPALRDDGDGSSSSTNADETISAIRQFERQVPDLNLRSTLSDQTLQYVRSLERRIRQLEEERVAGTNNVQQIPDPISGRPEAVVRALQVLEVREQLERDRITITPGSQDQMDDGEKALVREMCNVVWRKLEESPNGPNIDPL